MSASGVTRMSNRYYAVGRRLVDKSAYRYRRILPNAFDVDRVEVIKRDREKRRNRKQKQLESLVEGDEEDLDDNDDDDDTTTTDEEERGEDDDGEEDSDDSGAQERREARAARRELRRQRRKELEESGLSVEQRAYYGSGEEAAADLRLVKAAAFAATTGLPSFPMPSHLQLVSGGGSSTSGGGGGGVGGAGSGGGVGAASTTSKEQREQAEMVDWVCKPMTEEFTARLVRRTKQCWHLGRLLLPAAFRQWVRGTDLSRKDRFIAYRGWVSERASE